MEHLGLLSATSRLVIALKKLSKDMRRDRLRTGTGAGTFYVPFKVKQISFFMLWVWCGVWWAVL